MLRFLQQALDSRSGRFWVAISFYLWVADRVLPRRARGRLLHHLEYILPSPLYQMRSILAEQTLLRRFGRAALFAFSASFVAVLLLCWINAKLLPAGAARVQFFDDWQNMLLYAAVVPIFVGICSCMVFSSASASRSIEQLMRAAAKSAPDPSAQPTSDTKNDVSVFITLTVASVVTYNYVKDITNPERIKVEYWFHAFLMRDGTTEIFLNHIGTYYVILNFCLMAIIAYAVLCMIRMFVRVSTLGHVIRSNLLPALGESELKTALEPFIHCYTLAKLLAAALIVNIFIWGRSPLGEGDNYLAAMAAVALLGIAILPLPRYYIQGVWHDFHTARLSRAGDDGAGDEEDVRLPDFRSMRSDSRLTRYSKLIATTVDRVFFVVIFAAALNTNYVADRLCPPLTGTTAAVQEFVPFAIDGPVASFCGGRRA